MIIAAWLFSRPHMFSKYSVVKETTLTSGYCHTTGRKRKWTPLLSVPEDLERADSIERLYGSANRTPDRIRNDYIAFCRLNGYTSEQGIKPFIGQALRCGLKVGSVDTYLGYLRPLCRGLKSYHHWAAIVALAHADEDSKTAIDADLAALLGILDLTSLQHKPLIWLLIATGIRVRDAARLRRKQIQITEDGILKIELRITKNRRRRRHRAHLEVPVSWSGAPSRSIVRYLNQGDPEQLLFGNYNANVVNRILKACSVEKITTYTFRRRFFNELFEYFPPEQARSYTLHFSEHMFHAHYKRWSKTGTAE